jgi:hypothetical protein
MTFTFHGHSSVSWRWQTFRVTKHQQNDRKYWKNSITRPQRPLSNNPWARRHRWDQLWSLQEILTKIWTCAALLLHHNNAPTHTSQKTTTFVTNNNMVIVPHSPYLQDLATCDFTMFPKLKMKLKGQRFEIVCDNQRESQELVLDSIKENYFHGAFEVWKKTMGSLYTFPRRLFWRRWQPKLSKFSQHYFLDLVQEFSDYTLYNRKAISLLKNSLF